MKPKLNRLAKNGLNLEPNLFFSNSIQTANTNANAMGHNLQNDPFLLLDVRTLVVFSIIVCFRKFADGVWLQCNSGL